MAGSEFNGKIFNPQAFGVYVDNIPNLTKNALVNSGVLRGSSYIKNTFLNQTGDYEEIVAEGTGENIEEIAEEPTIKIEIIPTTDLAHLKNSFMRSSKYEKYRHMVAC